jgi:hydroxymethylbilane synthase
LAGEVRADDAAAREWAARLDHPASRAAAEAERSLLAALGGGCRVPIAAHAAVQGETLRLEALVISPDGRSQVRGALDGKSSHAAAVGGELGKKLQAQGAGDILAAVQELDRPVAGA